MRFETVENFSTVEAWVLKLSRLRLSRVFCELVRRLIKKEKTTTFQK
jgi:hypothetical protein